MIAERQGLSKFRFRLARNRATRVVAAASFSIGFGRCIHIP
jgi:hypothetical protein